MSNWTVPWFEGGVTVVNLEKLMHMRIICKMSSMKGNRHFRGKRVKNYFIFVSLFKDISKIKQIVMKRKISLLRSFSFPLPLGVLRKFRSRYYIKNLNLKCYVFIYYLCMLFLYPILFLKSKSDDG